jgi:hypothetical protein
MIIAFPACLAGKVFLAAHSSIVPTIVIASFSAVIATIVAWPVRILDITRDALRFRERRTP